jgi:hypothetical protein
MKKARRDGLYLMLLGSAVFLSLGALLASTSSIEMVDFRVLYYPAKCLLQHCDPYNENELLRFTAAAQGGRPEDVAQARQVMRYIYLPTAFSFTVPFALLPWGIAHFLWMALIAGSLVFASFLIWSIGADYAPILSGILVGFLLANSELLVITGNTAGLAISLCLVAVWCFLRHRFVPAGILCLAISLVLKPHDSGLVWLFFLLAGGVHRKRAWQTLLVTVALSLPAVLWVWHVAPLWMAELQSNIVEYAAPGNLNDPGLTSSGAHGLGMLVSLQSIFGVIWDNPNFYNPASYLVCAPLLIVWAFATLRFRSSRAREWLALAAIAPLTLLPVYHRQQDTKLLLLTIPACAMLWAGGGLIGKLALLVNAAGFFFTAELPWSFLLALIRHINVPVTWWAQLTVIAVQVFPVPLILLATAIFYLWIYTLRSSSHPPMSHEVQRVPE